MLPGLTGLLLVVLWWCIRFCYDVAFDAGWYNMDFCGFALAGFGWLVVWRLCGLRREEFGWVNLFDIGLVAVSVGWVVLVWF